MCNFPASPSTPSADKCCVIPSGNFRAKKPNWKSIHFESGPPINTSRASIWLNSHFSTFSSGVGHLGQNCSHEPKGELRAQGSFTTRNLAHSFFYQDAYRSPSATLSCIVFIFEVGKWVYLPRSHHRPTSH